MLENWYMVAPCWCWQIDVLVVWPESIQESAANTERTCATDRLNCRNIGTTWVASFLAQCQWIRQFAEIGVAANGRIFLVQFTGQNVLFSLQYSRQHVWFSIVVAISANAQINFLWIRITFECLGYTENGIGRSHCDPCEPWSVWEKLIGGKSYYCNGNGITNLITSQLCFVNSWLHLINSINPRQINCPPIHSQRNWRKEKNECEIIAESRNRTSERMHAIREYAISDSYALAIGKHNQIFAGEIATTSRYVYWVDCEEPVVTRLD